MRKLEELKAAYEASAPGEWEAIGARIGNPIAGITAETFGKTPYENAEFIALAHNLTPTLLQAAKLLQTAHDLVAEAVNVHIYDFDNGDVPDADCNYMAFLDSSKATLTKLHSKEEAND